MLQDLRSNCDEEVAAKLSRHYGRPFTAEDVVKRRHVAVANARKRASDAGGDLSTLSDDQVYTLMMKAELAKGP